MKPTVVKIGDYSGDAGHFSIKDSLEEAIERIGKEGAFEKGRKVMIVALDDTDECYNISFIQSGMRMSECITLCEVAKVEFLRQMGHISQD